MNKMCCKCGSEHITKRYHAGIEDCLSNKIRDMQEHLHYECASCGYDWIEGTSDNPRFGVQP